MKICKGFVQHINIEPDKIMPCCRMAVYKMPHSQITRHDDLEKYITMLESCVAHYQEFCVGCPDKGSYEVSASNIRELLHFSLIFINHHRNFCNCKCVYCNFWKKPVRPLSILPLLHELLTSGFVNREDANVFWGGGESTILPEFEEASTLLLERGLRQTVLTNALQYSPAAGSMLKEDRGVIVVSLDSGTEKTYRAIKGVDGFARVRDVLKRYAADARHVGCIALKYIIFTQNNSRDEIDAFFDLCASLGSVSVLAGYEISEKEYLTVSQKSYDALMYFKQKALENGHPYTDAYGIEHMHQYGVKASRLADSQNVYYWGCGEYYERHKHCFSHLSPRYILLDKNPDNIETIGGIPVRHPAEVLPQGERLPIIIFAWDPAPIMHTIENNYPWYTAAADRICLATD